MRLTEDTVEQPASEWLSEIGYTIVAGDAIAPGAPDAERENWADVVLVGRLRLGNLRDRRGETLFHVWRGDLKSVNPKSPLKEYADIPGFCRSAKTAEIAEHGFILTPGRYVGAADAEDDGEPFDDKMSRLTAELREQMQESARLDKLIWKNLKSIGYG